MFFTLPGNLPLGQHVMIAANAQADAAVALIGEFSIGQGVKIQVDHVVQGAHSGGHHLA